MLASVANVEEKLREELKKVKMTHAEGVVRERESERGVDGREEEFIGSGGRGEERGEEGDGDVEEKRLKEMELSREENEGKRTSRRAEG